MKRRNILIGLFYVLITLGIYAVYWYFSLLNGFAKETGRKDKIGWRVLGLGIITAGLYNPLSRSLLHSSPAPVYDHNSMGDKRAPSRDVSARLCQIGRAHV